MKGYLMEVGFDEETQKIDIDKISGNSASKRSKITVVREAVESLENKFGKLIPMGEVEKVLENQITEIEMEEAVDKLVKSGDLFKPKRGYIQRM